MRVIPVLDLKDGVVVRAIRGDRDNYQPIDTPLTAGSAAPLHVARRMLALADNFNTLYIADLDAIMGRGSNRQTVLELLRELPGIAILLDDGSRTASDVAPLAGHAQISPVIGSESLNDISDLESLRDGVRGGFALSLDWRSGKPLGPAAVFERTELWPDTVIVMTLDRVGARGGPDFARLRNVCSNAGKREVLAAGGVRAADDLRQLHNMGCGALISTALHDGSLSSVDLDALLAK